MKCFVFVFLALAILFPLSVSAQENSIEIRRAENYLRNLGTLKARFVQVDNYGGQMTGTFYLSRPGKLRFEYDQVDDFIVADGIFIYYYDAQLGEQSNAPIGQTLADFLLREDLYLDGEEIAVTDVYKDSGQVSINLVQRADPSAGNLRLGFQTEPYALRMWRVVDAQGFITKVYLEDIQTGIDLPGDLFVYIDPSHGSEPHYNE